MRGERAFVFAALLATVALSGCAGHAGSASPQSIELSRGPMRDLPVVLPPPPSPAVVERDAAEAQAAIEARERTIESTQPAPPARPDLDLAVRQGIQSRSLHRALRR